MKNPRQIVIMLTTALIGISLAACSGSAGAKTKTPEGAVEHIIDLFDESDYVGLCEVSLYQGEVIDADHPRHGDCIAHYEMIDAEYHLGVDKDEAKKSIEERERSVDGDIVQLDFEYATVGGESNRVQLVEKDGRWYQDLDYRLDKWK